jgi:hypothetical protein
VQDFHPLGTGPAEKFPLLSHGREWRSGLGLAEYRVRVRLECDDGESDTALPRQGGSSFEDPQVTSVHAVKDTHRYDVTLG